ncbi:MAG: threonine/serine exporter ThrE family protein [Lachnospiraceae bacterium]
MTESKQILALAVEIGDTLLRSGGEIYRVEDTILNILEAYGIEEYDVYVLANGIFATANESSEDASGIVRHVPLGAINLKKIALINQLSREICSEEISIEDAWKKLEECKNLPPTERRIVIFFCGFACGCFTYLFGGSLLDAVCAMFVGFLLQVFLLHSRQQKSSKFIKNIVGSALITSCSILLLNLGLPVMQDKIVIGDIMPLVPGIALTTSIRNLFNGDYLSGAIHLLDALLTAMCIAFGVGAVIVLYNLIPGGIPLS